MPEARPTLPRCPLCDSEQLVHQFTHSTTPIVRCGRCRLVMRNPQPSNRELAEIYNAEYFLVPDGEAESLKRGTAISNELSGSARSATVPCSTHGAPSRSFAARTELSEYSMPVTS